MSTPGVLQETMGLLHQGTSVSGRLSRFAGVLFAFVAVTGASGLSAPSAQAGVGASFSNRILEIQGSKRSEQIRVECNAESEVSINGEVKRLLANAPLPCSRVVEIDVISRGGSDRVDLRGVGADFGEANFRGFGVGTLTAVLAGRGNDQVECGEVFCFVPDAGPGRDIVRGSPRRDLIYGGADNDRLYGLAGRDQLVGRFGNDLLYGGDDDDLISGNQGSDIGLGQAGDDLVGGGAGNDRLGGGLGNDRLVGGAGRDRLDGGPGKNQLFQDFP